MIRITWGVIDGRAIKASAREHIKKRIHELSNYALSEARRTCPVKTGYLKSTNGIVLTASAYRFQLVARAFYAVFVHDGTRFMAARPWLLTATRRAMNLLRKNKAVIGHGVIKQDNTYPGR